MKYISEERLIEELESYDCDIRARDILNGLIDECQELSVENTDQWQTIDENTPKDRRILLHFKCSFGGHKGKTQVGIFNEVINLYIPLDSHGYSDDYIREYQPTHWQELPADPELPEPPK